jgi:hypothetical protein
VQEAQTLEVSIEAVQGSVSKEGTMVNPAQNGTQAWHLLLAWAFVGIPLAWGVAQTIANAMKLFY